MKVDLQKFHARPVRRAYTIASQAVKYSLRRMACLVSPAEFSNVESFACHSDLLGSWNKK